jgi:hypothetical protein
MNNQQLKLEAVKLRAAGMGWTAIGRLLNKSDTTIRNWVDPTFAEQQRASARRWGATLEGQCKIALVGSKHHSEKRGYVACNATVEQLVEAFTGHCDICGVAESDLPKRLSMDHCHDSGDFRGWLCNECNSTLGKLRDDVGAVLAYLRPDLAQRLLYSFIQK